MPIKFDKISLTEVWNNIDKIDKFNPNDIEHLNNTIEKHALTKYLSKKQN